MARGISGAARDDLVDGLVGQLRATEAACDVALRLARGSVSARAAREEVAAVEHEGDAWRAHVVESLTRALTSYLDREDLFTYSRAVDDVLDNLRDFVREVDLYGVRPAPSWVGVLEEIRVGVRALRAATECLRRDVRRVSVAALAAKKAPVRGQYQLAMAALLAEPLTASTLRRREVLRRLDIVGLRLSEAADHLATAAIKRGT
ncbi:DUF47 family protein [Cellulomonas sp. PS-H5]|uniref:DUF47 family protein n=1 Tax=Cellulomonas sp. PS-H5 TaxID=2820400 RepID=UPI001C4F65C0|nr:DUF47 family protein [Cellulomonas sp. PS-H5]MBW0252486.1 DUF47 family protein [Cellulomonas sp. PS-H5]